jgi:hypothetical protein
VTLTSSVDRANIFVMDDAIIHFDKSVTLASSVDRANIFVMDDAIIQ